MALIFNYSANNIDTAALPGAFANYSGSPTVGIGDGPQGINTIHTNAQTQLVWIPNVAIPINAQGFVLGGGFNITSFGSGRCGLMGIGDNGPSSLALGLGLNTDGSLTLAIFSQATLSSPSGTFTFGNRHEVELKISSFATGASVTVYLDGVPVTGLTAVTYNLGGLPDGGTIHSVAIGGNDSIASAPTPLVLDSVYALDTTGSAPCNAPLGPAISVPMIPNGVGQESAWTPNGASLGWQCISEIPPDGDTTYISDNTPNDEEACALSTPVGIIGVYGVSVISDQRQDTSGGDRTIALGLGDGSTRSYGTAWGLGTTYKMNSTPFSSNPFTSDPWTLADMTNLQVAAKLVT